MRRALLVIMFAAGTAGIAAAGAAAEIRKPQSAWLGLTAAAAVIAAANRPDGRWQKEVCATAFMFCVVTAGRLMVSADFFNAVAGFSLRPVVFPLLLLAAGAAGGPQRAHVWTAAWMSASAAVAAGLGSAYWLLSKQYEMDAPALGDAMFNVMLAAAGYAIARAYLQRPACRALVAPAVVMTALLLLAAGFAGGRV